jgi:hypothetical protein
MPSKIKRTSQSKDLDTSYLLRVVDRDVRTSRYLRVPVPSQQSMKTFMRPTSKENSTITPEPGNEDQKTKPSN